MARYLIADIMLFDDELYEVSDLGSGVAPVVIGAAASRCFSTLLEAQGAIVTKKALLYAGWERYGQQVSANSVNQSIAQIRRCLSTVGHSDFVVTAPRIGYKISDTLSIERLSDSAPSPQCEVYSAPLLAVVGENFSVIAQAERRSRRGLICLVGLLLCNTLLAFGWQGGQSSSPLASAMRFSYIPIPGSNNLHLFSAPGLNISPQQIKAHLFKLKSKPPAFTGLASYAYVYFNGGLRDNAYGYFLCQAPIEVSVSGCISYFVVDETE